MINKQEIRILVQGLKMITQQQKWILPISGLNAIITSSSPFFSLYMTALIIDELAYAKRLNWLFFYVILTIVVQLVLHLVTCGLTRIMEIKEEILSKQQDEILMNKAIDMDYEQLCDPKIGNLRRNLEEINTIHGGGLCNLLKQYESIILNISTIIMTTYFTISLFMAYANNQVSGEKGWISFFLMFGSFFLMFTAAISLIKRNSKKLEERQFEQLNQFVLYNRLWSYYSNEYLDTNQAGKDIKIYNQKHLIEEVFNKQRDIKSTFINKVAGYNGYFNGINAGILLLVYGFIYIFTCIQAINGIISIGDIVKYAGSINRFIGGVTALIIAEEKVKKNNKYIELLIEYLNIPQKKEKGAKKIRNDIGGSYRIEFRNVSFHYPESKQYAIKNLSVSINEGEHLAIVGMNGSGKTTFIKLLCRLYNPTAGKILLNGVNITEYEKKEYFKLLSVVFQDYKLFPMSIGQNISGTLKFNSEKAKISLRKAGLGKKLCELQQGVDSILNREYETKGIELSGGESQKLAMARALYKDAPIVILDEPTAALDPIAEYDIYTRFNDFVNEKTAIYISHRLSSCRFCDCILVFDEGKIIQAGKHNMLLKDEGGLYQRLWQAQSQHYF